MSRPVALLARWGVAAVLAVVFLVLMSSVTSFLHPVYGGDSAIFRVIGTALRHGQEMYVDIWDHKGPTLFLLQWLGQVIHEGRAGLFVLQTLFLTATLGMLIALSRRFTSWLGTAGVLALTLAVLSYTFEGGNLSEEFSLPFITFVLYGAVRALDEERPLSGWREVLLFAVMGAAFAFAFFMRANNAIPIAGIFAGFLIQSIVRRTPVIKRIAIAVLGFAAVSGGVLLWFAWRGTLDEMLNATFWFNLRYIEDASIRPKVVAYLGTIAFAAVLTAAGVIGQLLRFGARRSVWLVAVGLGLASVYAVLSPTTSYAHYLTLIVPMIAFAAMLVLSAVRGRVRLLIGAVLVIASIGVTIAQVPNVLRYSAGVHANEAAFEKQLDDVLSVVPDDRRAEIFPWSLPATYYLMTDTLPTYRYFITQPWWGSVDPQVPADTVAHLADTKQPWVLVPATGTAYEGLDQLLADRYTMVRENDRFQLYALR